MAGDSRAANLLGANPIVGNVASASLLLVLGWILGQLKWDHMLMAGLGIAMILVLFLAWRYHYALRHPPSHPLTRQELHDVLEELTSKLSSEQTLIEPAFQPGRDLPQPAGPEPASGYPLPGPGAPEPDSPPAGLGVPGPGQPGGELLPPWGPGQRNYLRLWAVTPRRTRWQAAFRQMLGVR